MERYLVQVIETMPEVAEAHGLREQNPRVTGLEICSVGQCMTGDVSRYPSGIGQRSALRDGSTGGMFVPQRRPLCHHQWMTSRIDVLEIDAVNPPLLAKFWCSVLDWVVVDQEDDDRTIGPAEGSGMRIDIIAVPDAKVVKNRLHLDLRADGCSTADELERLVALGARRVDVGQGPDVTWVVLADPEGNEFCLLSRTVQQAAAEDT